MNAVGVDFQQHLGASRSGMNKLPSFALRRGTAEERQVQRMTRLELEGLMAKEVPSTRHTSQSQRSTKSLRRGGSQRSNRADDWENRSVSSAPNLPSFRRDAPTSLYYSSSTSNRRNELDEASAVFSVRSESRLARKPASKKHLFEDDDDISSVGLGSVTSDVNKKSRSRRRLAKTLFGRRKQKKRSDNKNDYADDDRSVATSKSWAIQALKNTFSSKKSKQKSDQDESRSVVSDGGHGRKRRGGSSSSSPRRSKTDDDADETKSVSSYNSASSSIRSMVRRFKNGKSPNDDDVSLDSMSAVSANTQSSDKSKRSDKKFNIFKFLARQKKAKKIRNPEELPTFLVPERVAVPQRDDRTWVEESAPSVNRGASSMYDVNFTGEESKVIESEIPELGSTRSVTKTEIRHHGLATGEQEIRLVPSEGREIVFDCNAEETKCIDNDDDDGSVFTILSGIIAAWATETAAKKAAGDKSKSASPFDSLNQSQRKSCLKTDGGAKGRGSVKFGMISIREYERTVGDNPSVTSGPPISIGWCYMSTLEAAIEEYETTRPSRRSKREFYLTSDARKELLLNEWGYSVEEVRRAKREATYIQYHREKSAYQGLLSEKAQELAESTRRKVGRLRTGGNTKKEQAQLWDQAQERLLVLTNAKPPPTVHLTAAIGDTSSSDALRSQSRVNI